MEGKLGKLPKDEEENDKEMEISRERQIALREIQHRHDSYSRIFFLMKRKGKSRGKIS